MRIRSCQLVYVLLMLCSVQGLEPRTLAMLADSGRTYSALYESGARELPAATPGMFPGRKPALATRRAIVAGPVLVCNDAAHHAASVAASTSFARAV